MDSAPPPLPPTRNWWQRNWLWVVPTGCVLPLASVAIFGVSVLWLVTETLKNTAPYQTGVQRAEKNAQVISALGAPVAPGRFFSGHVTDIGPSGSAYLAIPIMGPKGKGVLYVDAYKSQGVWIYGMIKVHINGSNDEIYLN